MDIPNGLTWVKSSYSGGHEACVELASGGGSYYVRDSKDPNGPVLQFNHKEMKAFILGAKAGEFDHLI